MFQTQKFFDSAAPDQPSTTSATTETAQTTQVSPAEAMAKSGRLVTDDTVEIPVHTETKEEKPVQTETPSAEAANEGTQTTTETSPSPQTPEAENVTETVTTPEIQEVTETVTQPTWQEVLSKQQPQEVLKQLGISESIAGLSNDFPEGLPPEMVNFLQHWKNKGDVKEYLHQLTTDFKSMSSEDVMKHQLRTQYPKADARQLQVLYNKKVVEAYNLNSDDEDAKTEGQLLLDAEADRYRDELAENQKKFLIPQPPEVKPDDSAAKAKVLADQQEAERVKNFEVYKNTLSSDPVTTGLITNKFLSIGEGADQVKIPVQNPNELVDVLTDDKKWADGLFKSVKNQKGEVLQVPDVEKQLLIAAVHRYGKNFFKDYGLLMKKLGQDSVANSIQNVKPPEQGQPAASEVEITDPAAAMAKKGRIVSY